MIAQPVVLWTDALLWGLTAAVVCGVWRAARKGRGESPWRRVLARPAGVATAMVLCVFLIAALLDSLHFRPRLDGPGERYAVTVSSVLDVALGRLRDGGETTYSAPFATRSLLMKPRVDAAGHPRREYPRLRYAGAGLADPDQERARDIDRRVATGCGEAVVAFGLLAVAFVRWRAARRRVAAGDYCSRLLAGELGWPARSFLATAGILLLLFAVGANLAAGWHVLGTDKVGQDVLYAALKSVRTALVIGTLTTLVTLPLALFLGISAGYFGGWVDDAIQYVYTVLNAVPGVLLVAACVLILQLSIDAHPDWFVTAAQRSDARLLALCVILGLTSWTGLCRLLRAETLKLREMDYVQAAVVFGARPLAVLVRHILPNVAHLVVISVVLDFSGLVLAEAVLSYIGIGVDPTMHSWGNMINAARMELSREPAVWWTLAGAFGFMFALVLSANLFADGAQRAFDPRAEEEGGT